MVIAWWLVGEPRQTTFLLFPPLFLSFPFPFVSETIVELMTIFSGRLPLLSYDQSRAKPSRVDNRKIVTKVVNWVSEHVLLKVVSKFSSINTGKSNGGGGGRSITSLFSVLCAECRTAKFKSHSQHTHTLTKKVSEWVVSPLVSIAQVILIYAPLSEHCHSHDDFTVFALWSRCHYCRFLCRRLFLVITVRTAVLSCFAAGNHCKKQYTVREKNGDSVSVAALLYFFTQLFCCVYSAGKISQSI